MGLNQYGKSRDAGALSPKPGILKAELLQEVPREETLHPVRHVRVKNRWSRSIIKNNHFLSPCYVPGPCTHTISCESQNNPVTEVLFVILMSQTRKLRQRKVKKLTPVSQGSCSEYMPELGFEPGQADSRAHTLSHKVLLPQ